MWAYGVMDGANEQLTKWMLSCIAEPDFTVILDGVRHGRDRADDSYESDTEYQKRVRVMYVNWALSHDADHAVVVNANQPIENVTNDILVNMQKKGFRV
jgi:thymidylate kinase